MKTYSRHYCSRTHRSYNALARCIWRKAEWISGNGEYASLAHCGVLTVELHKTLESVQKAKAVIDNSACGHRCVRDHEIVRLAAPTDAERWRS